MSTAEIVKPPLLYPGQRLGRDEFYQRLEEWEESGRNARGIERLEGVVYMPAASIRMRLHAVPHGYISGWLASYSATSPGTEFGITPTSKLDNENDPEGDAVLRILPEYGGQSQTDRKGYIVGAPELIVELTGTTQERDLQLKFEIYRRNGVREYLVWETIAEEFHWFVLDNGDYRRIQPDDHGLIESSVFPGLWLDVNSLLDGDLAKVLQVVQQGLATDEHKEFVAQLAAKRQAAK